MLTAHLNNIEEKLSSDFKVSSIAGHSLNKGSPREHFIRDFLKNHLPNIAAIGTGEIIGCNSEPGDRSRNQFDIVIYKNNYPKIHLSEDINAYLIESVIATIEVKSTLDKEGLTQAIIASRNVKLLERNIVQTMSSGYIPPSVLNFIVAYQGPTTETVMKWIDEIYTAKGIHENNAIEPEKRLEMPSASIDGIFILNRGFIQFDNSPADFRHAYSQKIGNWVYCDTTNGNLTLLFVLLTQSMANMQGSWLNVFPYLKGFSVHDLKEKQIGLTV